MASGVARGAAGRSRSRALVTSGKAVAAAARKARDKALRLAGELLEASTGDIELGDGAAQVSGVPGRRHTLGAPPADLELGDGAAQVGGVPGRRLALGALATLANPIRYAYGKEAAEAALKLRKARPGAVLLARHEAE